VRFMALAIFLTGDLLRECAFSSRTSAFDQERRFARLPCLLAILTPCDTIARTDNGGARTSRVELAASSHLSDLEVLHSPPTSADCDLRLPQIVGRKTQWNFYCWLWEPQCSVSGGSGPSEKVFNEFWKPFRGRLGPRRGRKLLDDHKAVDFSLQVGF